ncbi:MAG: MarR family winged helix-turn-helix transcriptional regulator [Halohasta sp.]
MSVHDDPTAGGEPATGDGADRWDTIRDLPPSSKLVAKTLDHHDSLTQSELAEETLLSTRTVREAVARLEAADAVDSRVSFRDARKQLYSLTI